MTVKGSDERLVERMAAGDEEALIELHRRYAPYLTAMTRRMLDFPAQVHGCVQDIFVSAWEGAAHFDPARASAKTWLVTLAHRLILSRLHDEGVPPISFEAWRTRAKTRASAGHADIDLGRAEHADEEARKLLELAFYGGHSLEALAELTGKPLSAVQAELRAAMRKLRDTLKEGGEE